MRQLGVVGTMVWDRIYGRGVQREPVEEWGGIAYALAAFDAALPPDWTVIPLVKVGRDLIDPAQRFLKGLDRVAATARFIEVPATTNRVTLRYDSAERRSECLQGGIPPWRWDELGPMVRDLDVLYLNFISGFELDLDTARALRRGFDGPIYADLHSLLLDLAPDGMRVPRGLPDAPAWFGCFDVVQLNADELTRIGGDPMGVAASALGTGVGLLVVTTGPNGAVYFTTPTFSLGPSREIRPAPAPTGPIVTERVPAPPVTDPLDPTGCGDVFGATLLSHLLRGDHLVPALRAANAAAARNVSARGATHLQYHLRGGIVPR